MQIKEVNCITALSKSNLPGLDYSLNPYRGCLHNCAYCYVPNVLRIKRDAWGRFVDIKKNIPKVLSNELRNKKRGVIAISTVTDPYQPLEKKYKITRYCLEQLLIYDFPICLQTKSKLIERDLDIISKFSNAEIMFSIGTLNDNERKLLEPYASTIKERLDTLKISSEIGIKTSIFFGPIYPTISSENLPKIIDTFKENGAKEIMIDKFNLKPGIKENIEKKIVSNKLFQEKFANSNSMYILQKEKLYEIGKKTNIKIVDAF
ncbi:MAG: DNA photolyase [Thermoplasmatales archaeon SG8-52-3]|nr:MAG: DNA photolyase [Thermoplasmatales archaeon SG8-52-3]